MIRAGPEHLEKNIQQDRKTFNNQRVLKSNNLISCFFSSFYPKQSDEGSKMVMTWQNTEQFCQNFA